MRISDWSSDVCSSDLQKHLALTGHIYNSAYIVISEAFYQSLSDEQRTAIEEAAKEAGDCQFDYIAQRDEELLGLLEEAGMEVTRPDPAAFREATDRKSTRLNSSH